MERAGTQRAAEAAIGLGTVAGNLSAALKYLSTLPGGQAKKLSASIPALVQRVTAIGGQLARLSGTSFRAHPDHDMDTVADYLTSLASAAAPLARRSGAGRPDAAATREKARLEMKMYGMLRGTLVATQHALMGQLPTQWDQVKPFVVEVLRHLSAVKGGAFSEGRRVRKSVTIESRLAGRLATVGITRTHNSQLASVELRRSLGDRLATLVESGDRRAIRLAGLIERRRRLRASDVLDAAILESVEAPIAKLSSALGLAGQDDGLELLGLMRLATSPNSFNSKRQFSSDLMEGLILNVTTMASGALSIPSGQYVVWATTPKSTMLVPTSEAVDEGRDVMAGKPGSYDIVTADLLGCWNKVERVIGEDSGPSRSVSYDNPQGGDERVGRPSLKKKVESAGGVRATAEITGLSPGDVSKHVNDKAFNISTKSAEKYMSGIGADPDDLFKLGQVNVWDYDTSDTDEAESERRREDSEKQYRRSERERTSRAKQQGGGQRGGRRREE